MENRQPRFPVLLALLIVLGASNCSIKEDRRACPCSLSVELKGLPAYPVSVSVSGAGIFEARGDTTLVVSVPKSGVDILALSGAALSENGSVHIPLGFDSPPLYLFSARVPTEGETARVQVKMNKHFCTLSLEFDGPPGWGEPYWAEVRGEVDGIGPDGAPEEGAFGCRLDTGFSCRLPRQAPGQALWLDITMPDRVVRSFPLGSCMQAAGYDWTAPDLADLTLRLDFSLSELHLNFDKWSRTIPFPVTI